MRNKFILLLFLFSIIILIKFVNSGGDTISNSFPDAKIDKVISDNISSISEDIPLGDEKELYNKIYSNNGNIIIISSPFYSASYFSDNSPLNDSKNLTIEIQIHDLNLDKYYSLVGNTLIPKYYGGHFYFNTSKDSFLEFEGLSKNEPNVSWKISNTYLDIKNNYTYNKTYLFNETTRIYELKSYSIAIVDEKEFNSYSDTKTAEFKKIYLNELYLDPDVSACGDLDTPDGIYTLTQDVNSSRTCFNINADNITLDCNGYNINYSQMSPSPNEGYGINATGYNFLDIKNCDIFDVNGGGVGNDDYAIYLLNSNNITVENNNITTFGSYSKGIMLENSDSDNIYSNNIDSSSNGVGYGSGITLSDSDFNLIDSNTIISSGQFEGTGISLSGGLHPSRWNIVSSNKIDIYGNSGAVGINDNSINNLSLNTISLFGSRSSDVSPRGLDLSGTGKFIDSNSISMQGSNSYGILITSTLTNTTLSNINMTLNGSSSYGLYVLVTSETIQFTFSDSYINSSDGKSAEIYLQNPSSSSEFNFTNVSRNDGGQLNITGNNGTLNRFWYLDVNVTNGTDSIQNANVTINDVNNLILDSELTPENGLITKQIILEMMQNETNSFYYTPHTINTTLIGYNDNSTDVNFTLDTNIQLDVILELDTTLPTRIDINFPDNTTYSTNVSEINYTFSEKYPESCWYSLDSGDINSTRVNCGTNWTNLISNEGNNIWYLYINDTSGNINQTSVTFFKDTIYPDIDWGDGVEANESNVSQSNIYFNVTYTETNLRVSPQPFQHYYQEAPATCTSGSGMQSNNPYYNWTGLSDGTYNYCTKIWDIVGNSNVTDQRVITLDTTPPTSTASATSPPSGSSYTFNTWTNDSVKVTISAVDSGIGFDNTKFPIYCNDSVNSCTPDSYISSGATLTTEGTTYIRYLSNDTLENTETINSQIIKIDKTNPDITILYPTSSILINSNTSIELNFSTSDSYSGLDTCWYSLNGGTDNSTISNCLNTTIDVPDGIVTLNIYSNDSIGNNNFSESVSFTTDVTFPIITIDSITSNQNYSTNIFDLNYTYTEANPDSCWYANESENSTRVNCGTNWTSLTANEGNNLWYSYVNDSAGNENYTSVSFFVDTIIPDINYDLQTSEDYINISSNSIYVNITATETNFANITFSLFNDTDTVNETIYFTLIQEINWSGMDDNNYSYQANITDISNNQNGTSLRYITLDTANPNAVLNTPENATYTNSTDINFTSNLTDNLGIENATIYIYNDTDLFNQTSSNELAPNSLSSSFGEVISTLVDGIYNWFITIWDWAGNTFTSGNNTLTIDTINPSIQYEAETYPDGIYRQAGDIFINISITEINMDTVNLDFNNVNQSFSNTEGNSYWVNKTGLSEGNYSFYAWINDSANNFNYTSTRTIGIDLNNPSISIILPTASAYNYNSSLDLNFTISENNLDSCWYNFDYGTNISLASCENTTFDISEGTHNLYIYANDSSQRESVSSVEFSVSLAPPGIVLNYPPHNQWLNYNTNVQLNYTPSDTNLDTCELWTNFTSNFELNQSDTSPISDSVNSFNVSSILDGGYIWNVWCNDSANNGAWGGAFNYTFNIDTLNPGISYGFGTSNNDTNTTSTYIYVNVSVIELNEDSITFSLTNSTDTINQTSFIDNTREITWINLLDDTYYYIVSINDSAGNENSTDSYTIRLDDTKPTITIDSPKSQNYGNNDSLYLNYSASDNLIGLKECWYYAYNSSSDLIISTTSLSSCENTTFSLPSGDTDYTLTLFAQDILDNVNSKSVTFGIRTESPAIVLSPINETYSNTLSSISFNFTVTTNADSMSTCELWGNWSGDWILNQTLTSISESSINEFSLIDLREGDFEWNVWCNDSLNNAGWALNNNTFIVDLTSPKVNITSPINETSFTGLTTTIYYNISDTYSDSCYFSLKDSSDDFHNYAENTSLDCSENGTRVISTLSYGTFTFYLYGKDQSGNENSSEIKFTNSAPSSPGGGGGGGSAPKEDEYPVVSFIQQDNLTSFDELNRAIIFSTFNNYCEDKVSSVLALVNYYTECSLTLEDLNKVQQQLNNKNIYLKEGEILEWYKLYKNNWVTQFYTNRKNIEEYDLLEAIVINPMILNPNSIDTLIIARPILEYVITSNKALKECKVISSTPQLGCEIAFNTTIKVTYNLTDLDFFNKAYQGKISVTSLSDTGDTKEEETRYVNIRFNAINLSFKSIYTLFLPLWIAFLVYLISFILFITLLVKNRKIKVNKTLSNVVNTLTK